MFSQFNFAKIYFISFLIFVIGSSTIASQEIVVRKDGSFLYSQDHSRTVCIETFKPGQPIRAAGDYYLNNTGSNPALSVDTSSRAISLWNYMNIATLPASRSILCPSSMDMDGDGNKELVISEAAGWSDTFWIYESLASNDLYNLAHTLQFASSSSAYPSDFGDSDNDSLKEILVYGRTSNDFWIRTYEETLPPSYPTNYAAQIVPYDNWWGEEARITDLDSDGLPEICYISSSARRFSVNETTGNNQYAEVYSVVFNQVSVLQDFAMADDLNGNGKKEVILGGVPMLYIYECSANNVYTEIWSVNTGLNAIEIIDTGDIDGDNRRDFLLVGMGANYPDNAMRLQIYESNCDCEDDFDLIYERVIDGGASGSSAAAIGDTKGNGSTDIGWQVVGSNFMTFELIKATDNNKFTVIWNRTISKPPTVALYGVVSIGDVNENGKDEILFNEYKLVNGQNWTGTKIYEWRKKIVAEEEVEQTMK